MEKKYNSDYKPSIFLSHTWDDKQFAKKLSIDLQKVGVRVWLDVAEIKVGDSLIEKIREGIDSVDYLGVILSPQAVKSDWVKREVDIAMNQEINGRRIKVLPLMYKKCDLPWFLEGKLFADFTSEESYERGLNQLIDRLLTNELISDKKCIVLMPKGNIYENVYNIILNLCNELRISCELARVDLSQERIIKKIAKDIYDADIVIGDISENDPAIFYNLGISHCLPYPNKTIIISRDVVKPLLSTNSYLIILYDITSPDILKSKIKSRILKIFESGDDISNPIRYGIGYYEGQVLTQDKAANLHHITLERAFDLSKHSLVLMGTTLHSVRNQFFQRKMLEKLNKPEFSNISLIIRTPTAKDVSKIITRDILAFVKDEDFSDFFSEDKEKFTIYICEDFVRYSATYIDHTLEKGIIRVTHSIYGALMQEAPSYALTRKRSPELYQRFVDALEDLIQRKGTYKVASLADIENYKYKYL